MIFLKKRLFKTEIWNATRLYIGVTVQATQE